MGRPPWWCVVALACVSSCTGAGGPYEPAGAAQAAAALMRDLAARQLFQGAVVIARDGRVEYAEGFGYADRERQAPFTPATPTDTGSIAKTFTAAGLMLLADEGRIDLDARVRDVLPAYPHADTRIRHLLSHAAGLPGYEWFDPHVAAGEPRTNQLHLALLARLAPPTRFAPGHGFAYDNVAYDLAAMVIERVTGESFASFIDARFARPLGLAAFIRPVRFADWPGVRTRGYRRGPEGWQPHDAYDVEGFYGGGNIYLSAEDLQRWAAGFPRVMGANLRRALTPARLDDGRQTGLSEGSWYVSPDAGRRYYTGHHNGFHSVAYADDARGLSVGWVANDAPPAWLQSGLTRALAAVAEGRPPEPLTAPPAPSFRGDPLGRYAMPGIGEVVVVRGDQRLQVVVGDVTYDAYEVEPGVHYVPGVDASLSFHAQAGGQPSLSWDSVFVVASRGQAP